MFHLKFRIFAPVYVDARYAPTDSAPIDPVIGFLIKQ